MDRNSLLYPIWIYRHLRYTATNCAEQTVAPYYGLYLVAELMIQHLSYHSLRLGTIMSHFSVSQVYRCKTRLFNSHLNAVPVSCLIFRVEIFR